MFIWDWLTSALGYLGLYKKPKQLLLLGVDNAGKTSLFYMLKDNIFKEHTPTIHPTCEELPICNIDFRIFDLGDQYRLRRFWKEYFPAIDAIAFMIDSCDRDRFQDSKNELDYLLKDDDLTKSNCPVLILGNKTDKADSVSEDELKLFFGLHKLTTGKDEISSNKLAGRPLELLMCSILERQGYNEGLYWLAQHMH